MIFFGGGEGVQRHLHTLVADGVEADLESGVHALFRHLGEHVLFILWQAGIVGIVGVGFEQRGGARTQGSIHEALEHAGVQQVVRLGMRRAMLLQYRQGIVEGQPFGDARGELAFPFDFFEDLEIIPGEFRVAGIGIVLRGSDAAAGQFLQSGFHGLRGVCHGWAWG